ncbi:MAG: avidin/streptavidin family protein [Rhizomicrobium sp.]
MSVKAIAAATVVLFAAGTFSPALAAGKAFAAGSTWHNELGSTLTITTYNPNSGLFAGTYVTAVASPGCQAVGKPLPVTGWLNTPSNAMTFAVNWTPTGCNSVTSWSGRFNPSNGQIPTIWTLTGSAGWSNMNIGMDLFVP